MNVPVRNKGLDYFIAENFFLILGSLFIIATIIVLLVIFGGATEDTTFHYTSVISQGLHSFCSTALIFCLILVAGYLLLTMMKYL